MKSHILSVGQCYIYRSPCATMYVNNKYIVLMYLVCLDMETLPFLSKRTELLLSCRNVLYAIVQP